MKKKITITLMAILALICITTQGVFAAPQSSPNMSAQRAVLKEWVYSGTKNISNMRGASGTMGNTGSLDVHLQRNTEYGAMLILGISDYGKQASGVNYNSLFTETSNGLATTTGNVSGIYQVGNSEFVAAGKPEVTYNYYLNLISKTNRDEYTNAINSSQKRGDAMNLFGNGTATSSNWLRQVENGRDYDAYYGITRSGFGFSAIQTYTVRYKTDERFDYGKDTTSNAARAVVTQYN